MRIKLTLKSAEKQAVLPINYNYYLTGLIYKFIFSSSKDYSSFLHNEGYRIDDSKKGFKLFTYSMLNGKKYSIKSDKIIFENAPIEWEISSPVDVFLQHLITGAFKQGQVVSLGNNQIGAEFLIEQVETASKPDFKETMRFTCLSPITVSKLYDKNITGKIDAVPFQTETTVLNKNINNDEIFQNSAVNFGCHYIRPWEDDFSKAIEQNLIKKYSLIYGKAPDGYIKNSCNLYENKGMPKFKITIDNDYMNRKSGKITKKINFKNTEIIGFMAPFEVTGSTELIEIGYEAGFGEKGSIGCGCIKAVKG
jgi:CRISPR-associated endoribonuclease Cas6